MSIAARIIQYGKHCFTYCGVERCDCQHSEETALIESMPTLTDTIRDRPSNPQSPRGAELESEAMAGFRAFEKSIARAVNFKGLGKLSSLEPERDETERGPFYHGNGEEK